MPRRVIVSHHCEVPCAGCTGCRDEDHRPTLLEVLRQARAAQGEIVLGGGDATTWPALAALCHAIAGKRDVWVEAPVASLTPEACAWLRSLDVAGVVIQVSSPAPQLVEDVEAAGLSTRLRLLGAGPNLQPLLDFAAEMSPRTAWLEVDLATTVVDLERLQTALAGAPNVSFSGHRLRQTGLVPPCLTPDLWQRRPHAWRSVLSQDTGTVNRSFSACQGCVVNTRCRFSEPGQLGCAMDERASPVLKPAPWQQARPDEQRMTPSVLRRGGRAPDTRPPVICTTPWTTMELSEPDGRVHQCCRSWTTGHRGEYPAASLTDIWNGPGFQMARRVMASGSVGSLCAEVCPRLHDHAWSERRFQIRPGSPAFVNNQRLLIEELDQRREVLTAMPLHLAIAPSTYCNFNCIMCECGRTPTRAMSPEIWGEIERFLPTLSDLTLLGGEPLANREVMDFLRRYDRDQYPDARVHLITNGALLTARVLRALKTCSFGGVTVSLNAGTAQTFERVQRGVPLATILANVDALREYRAAQPPQRYFAINLSFVVMPENAHELIAFGMLAAERQLDIRLLPLSPDGPGSSDFYKNPDEVERILAELNAFESWAQRVNLSYASAVAGVRSAITHVA